MRSSDKEELYRFVEQLSQSDDREAHEVLCALRDRIAGSGGQRSRGYAKALLRDAMRDSRGKPQEWGEQCIESLTASYNHPPLGGAGCWSFEGPSWILTTPTPPTLTAALPTATRRYLFSNAGSGGARIVGLMANVRDLDTGAGLQNARVSAQVAVNGSSFLTTNGQIPAFVSFANLFNHDRAYFPFSRLVSSRDFIDVNFRADFFSLGVENLAVDWSFVMGPLPYVGQVVQSARDYILAAMRGTQGDIDTEFHEDCIQELWERYSHREWAPAGCWTFESPTRLLDTEDTTLGQVVVPPQQTRTRTIVFSQGGGLICGIMGSLITDTDETLAAGDMALCSVQLSINGGENIVVDGRQASFVSYAQLFSAGAAQLSAGWRDPWVPIRRLVASRDFLQVTWRNNAPLGGPDILPKLTLAFGRLS